MEDINTITIMARSVFTLRFTMKQKCDLRWKYKTEKGDIGFGVEKKACVQTVLSREEISAYHITAEDDTKNEENVVPDIQINDENEEYVGNHQSITVKYRSGGQSKGSCAVELCEEVDEMGSFSEDQTTQAETAMAVKRVRLRVGKNVIP